MPSFLLQISNLNLLLRCPAGVIIEEPDVSYSDFWRLFDGDLRADIEIELVFADIDERQSKTLLFQTGQSWAMFRTAHGYCLELKPESFSRPVWQAAIDPDFSHVILTYAEDTATKSKDGLILHNPLHYPFDQIVLMHLLAFRRGAVIHSAGMEIDDRGIVFPGRSGAGKSTLSVQLEQTPEINILSDDRIIVREIEGQYKMFGTPWPGEAGHAANRSAPLKTILFINHGQDNRIVPLSRRKCLEKLLPVSSIPWYHPEIVATSLLFFDDLIASLPAYDLYFKPGSRLGDDLKSFIRQL